MPCPSLGWAARLDLARPLAASFGSKGYASGYEKLFSLSTEEILQKLPSNVSGIDLFLILRGFRGGRRAVVSSGRRLRVGLDLRSGWDGLRCWGRRCCRRCLRLNCGGLVLVQKPAEPLPLNEGVLVDLAVLNDSWKSARLIQLIHAGQLDDSVTELLQLLIGGGGVLKNTLDVGID